MIVFCSDTTPVIFQDKPMKLAHNMAVLLIQTLLKIIAKTTILLSVDQFGRTTTPGAIIDNTVNNCFIVTLSITRKPYIAEVNRRIRLNFCKTVCKNIYSAKLSVGFGNSMFVYYGKLYISQ